MFRADNVRGSGQASDSPVSGQPSSSERISSLTQGRQQVRPQAVDVAIDIPSDHISHLTTSLDLNISKKDSNHIVKFMGQLIESAGIVATVDFCMMVIAKAADRDVIPKGYGALEALLRVSVGLAATVLGFAIEHSGRKMVGVNDERIRHTVGQLNEIAHHTNDRRAILALHGYLNQSEKRASIYKNFTLASGLAAAGAFITGIGLILGGGISRNNDALRASVPILLSSIPAIAIGNNLKYLSDRYTAAANYIRTQLQALEHREESDHV